MRKRWMLEKIPDDPSLLKRSLVATENVCLTESLQN